MVSPMKYAWEPGDKAQWEIGILSFSCMYIIWWNYHQGIPLKSAVTFTRIIYHLNYTPYIKAGLKTSVYVLRRWIPEFRGIYHILPEKITCKHRSSYRLFYPLCRRCLGGDYNWLQVNSVSFRRCSSIKNSLKKALGNHALLVAMPTGLMKHL